MGIAYARQPGVVGEGDVQWTDQSSGDADLDPVLSIFSDRNPVTIDHAVELDAYGLPVGVTPSTNGSENVPTMSATYNAGEVAITGENGKITSVRVISPTEGEGTAPTIRVLQPRAS